MHRRKLEVECPIYLLDCVYFRGKNEIIFRKSADGVRGELDFHPSPSDGKIGVVTFRLRYGRYFVGERHCFYKIPECKFLMYRFPVCTHCPAIYLLEQLFRKRTQEWHSPAFARDTFLLRQIHPATLSRATIVLMKMLLRKFFAVCEVIFDTVLPLRGRSARTKGRTAEEIPLCPTVHE